MADQHFVGDGNAGVANAGPLPRVGGVTSQAGVATSIAPKTSNKSKSGTLSDSQIAKSVLLNNVGFNRERTNKRNVPNDVDFNEVRMPEFGQEKQLSFEKSDGGTKSKVGRLISQFQEFAKASFK